MKRFIFCSALSGLICISGCSAQLPSPSPDIDKPFTAEVKIKAGSELVSGNVTRTAENCWELTFTEPFALEGLTATLDENGTSYEMGGFEAAADISEETASMLRLLAEGYDSAAKNGTFSENTFTAATEHGSCTLALGENNAPSVMRMGEANFYAELSEWTECEPTVTAEEDDFVVE